MCMDVSHLPLTSRRTVFYEARVEIIIVVILGVPFWLWLESNRIREVAV